MRGLGVVAVAALALGACSSSTKTAAPTTTAGGTKAAAPAGSPINVGVIASLTGPQAGSSSQAGTVGPAWERYVNEQLAGINGHPVKVFVEDDGNDPAKAQTAEKTLVDSDNVTAIVVGSDNLVSAYDGDALSKGVPVISGPANLAADWNGKAGMYPTVTDIVSGLTAQVLVAKQFGKATKVANIYCAEVAACQQANPVLQGAAAKAGVGFTSLAVSSTAPSYTAQCLQLQQQKADYVELAIASTVAGKLIQDCQAQGYNPTWGSSEQAIGKDFLSIPNLTVYGPAYAFPSVASAPPVQAFVDAMTKYAKDGNWREGSASFTWSGLEVLRKALANVGPNPTKQDAVSGLNSLQAEDLGGLLANKLSFTAGKPIAIGSHPCYFVVGIKDGRTIAPAGLTPSCVS
jgi:branched-chain amino acid transport system substrate-binding protein